MKNRAPDIKTRVFKRFALGMFFSLGVLLTGCATSNPTIVHHINDLAQVDTNSGSFNGIESMARPVNGTNVKRVNIVYIHGIGWTENANNSELGNSFLKGIAEAYDGVDQNNFVVNRCRLKYHDIDEGELDHTFIETSTPVYYETGLAGSALSVKKLACMDKQVLQTTQDIEFVVYRVFWDEAFWKALQAPHIGYDDNYGQNNNIAPLRKKINRKFKDDIVNYGFSDAVMYMGPAGEKIREAVYGAVCSAVLDASGHTFVEQGHVITKAGACNDADKVGNSKTHPFVFVTESLGSKIIFDVFRETMSDGRYDVLDKTIEGSEIFMLANQIPLLSLSNLSPVTLGQSYKPFVSKPKTRPRIIALTELNDFLSYELVPFYETLYGQAYDLRNKAAKRSYKTLNAPGVRAKMIDDIGFDIVDMRIEFADPLFPVLKNLVDPKQAHSDHVKQPKLMKYLLCGARNGQLNADGCIAAKDKQ